MNMAKVKKVARVIWSDSMARPPTSSTIHMARAGSRLVIAGRAPFTRTSRSCWW